MHGRQWLVATAVELRGWWRAVQLYREAWFEGQASGEKLGRPPCHVRDESRRRIS